MIISDLCDEYTVLVSQGKAPAYGYDNVNVPYGLDIDKVGNAYVVGGINAVNQDTANAIADSLGLRHAQ